ncbi:MAG: P-II family nitrogen regulator [Aquificota bacterium]|nr:P-II family nitrogen regulator [Aquificota bacterium]
MSVPLYWHGICRLKNGMVEVLAVIRKERSYLVRERLAEEGVPYVSWTVKGRGKEGGLRYKGFFRERVLMPFLPKTAFMVWSEDYRRVVDLFLEVARTGSYGDGKVFVVGEEVSGMKMVKAVIRPDRAYEVIKALEREGFKALTMWDVVGRGREGGVRVGDTFYDELAKTVIMVAVEEERVERLVRTIVGSARTGAYGDGKVFVCNLSEVWTIRTGEREL